MPSDFTIIPYSFGLKNLWDEFVDKSKNGTFLFKRDYMDYHSDRFTDNSYLFLKNDNPYAILPACKIGDTLSSHAGLTYGGLIMSEKCTCSSVLGLFEILIRHLINNKFTSFIYKPVPHIYHKIPSEEDLYALFRHNAKLKIRNVSSTIKTEAQIRFHKDRREAVRRAVKNGLFVELSDDLDSFWEILTQNLISKHGVLPVHTLSEMKSLMNNFPDNIKLYITTDGSEILAGVLCYLSSQVMHCQYISANERGKKTGAVDLIIKYLLDNDASSIPFFDFGISNEDSGRYLNESLIYQKEGFGGRAICYDTYEITL